MTTHLDISDIESADGSPVTVQDLCSRVFAANRRLHQFVENRLIPILIGQVDRAKNEEALLLTYYRMANLVKGVVQLEDFGHFQLAQMTSRTLFELVLDLNLLSSNKKLADQFFAFTEVKKVFAARCLLKFLDEHPSVDRNPHHEAISVANDAIRCNKANISHDTYWPNSSKTYGPNDWYGKTIPRKAKDVGVQFEEMYHGGYFLQCAYVHSGPLGVAGLTADQLAAAFGVAHFKIRQLFIDATKMLAGEFHLFEAVEGLREEFQLASAHPSEWGPVVVPSEQ